jgi:uncharacterized membrane protein YfcA
MAITGSAGAFLGSQVTRFVPVTILLVLIAALVIYESFMMLRSYRKHEPERAKPASSATVESIIGFGIGFVGGLVGLVLGSIRLPAMIAVLKMEPRVAIGTNLAAASVMGASGLMGHILNGSVDYFVLAAMGPSAILGAMLGAKLTNRFNAQTLKLIIGITLMPIAVLILVRAFLVNS